MIVETIFLTVFIVLSSFLMLAVRSGLRREAQYQAQLETQAAYYEDKYQQVQEALKRILNGIREVDIGGVFKVMGPEDDRVQSIDGVYQVVKEGAFEQSDEVSTTFDAIKDLIDTLQEFIETPQQEENEEKIPSG